MKHVINMKRCLMCQKKNTNIGKNTEKRCHGVN